MTSDLSLSERRLLHAKGMRASLKLLLEDPAMDVHPYARAVVHDHLDRCQHMIDTLEAETPEAPKDGAWPREIGGRMRSR